MVRASTAGMHGHWDRQNRHSIPGSGSSYCSAVAGDDEDDVTGAFGN